MRRGSVNASGEALEAAIAKTTETITTYVDESLARSLADLSKRLTLALSASISTCESSSTADAAVDALVSDCRTALTNMLPAALGPILTDLAMSGLAAEPVGKSPNESPSWRRRPSLARRSSTTLAQHAVAVVTREQGAHRRHSCGESHTFQRHGQPSTRRCSMPGSRDGLRQQSRESCRTSMSGTQQVACGVRGSLGSVDGLMQGARRLGHRASSALSNIMGSRLSEAVRCKDLFVMALAEPSSTRPPVYPSTLTACRRPRHPARSKWSPPPPTPASPLQGRARTHATRIATRTMARSRRYSRRLVTPMGTRHRAQRWP